MTPLPCPPERWPAFSRRLDEAMALPAGERGAWLAALPVDDADLREPLARVLAGVLPDDAPFLQAPRLPVGDEAGPAPAAGQRVGPYELLRMLGRGGMGEVWLARRADGAYEREVALKLPHAHWLVGALRERFDRERDILAGLSHAHIARFYDAGLAANGQPYLALEAVEGQPLTDWCREQSLPLSARLALFDQVLQAVAHAHARLVAHRDLKPANVLVTPEGQVKLLDFGIAKLLQGDGSHTDLTQVQGVLATPQYAAPEQLRGGAVSVATDVYALGLMLFELLTDTLARAAGATLAEPPLPSRVAAGGALRRALAGDLDAIVHKALQPEPDDRYPSVAALADDLQRHRSHQPIEARRITAWHRAAKFVRRHRLPVALSAAALLAVLGGAGGVWWQAQEAQAQARRAQAVSSFLVGLFNTNSVAQPDPQQAQQTTALTLMDRAAARVREGFADDPFTAQDLLQTLADVYIGMGRDDRAEQLLAERVRVIRERLPGRPELLAAALVSQGGGLWETKQLPALKAVLEESGQLMQGLRQRDPLLWGNWHFLRGDLLRQDGLPGAALPDYEAATGWFQQAEAARPGSAPHLQHLLVTLGQEQLRVGRLQAANATLDLAVQRARAMGDTKPTVVAMTLSVAGRVRQGNDDLAGAEQAFRESVALYRRAGGDDHPGVPNTEVSLLQLLSALGRRDEVLAMEGPIQAAFERKYGPRHAVALTAQIHLARARLLMGDLDAAERRLQALVSPLAAAPGQALRLQSVHFDLATVACLRGQAEPCAAALQAATQAAPQAVTQNERVRWQHAVLQARVAALRQQGPAALQALAQAVQLAQSSGQVQGWEKRLTTLWQAQLLLQQANAAGAAALLDPMAAEMGAPAPWQNVLPLQALWQQTLGELRLQQRRGADAVAALTRAVALRQASEVADSPALAHARRLLEAARGLPG